MSLEEAVAIVATRLGIVDEEAINNMSIVFFDEVFESLGKILTYEAVSNYAGNSFCKDSWEMIMEHHPLTKTKKSGKGLDQMVGILGNMKIRTVSGPIEGVTTMRKTQKG